MNNYYQNSNTLVLQANVLKVSYIVVVTLKTFPYLTIIRCNEKHDSHNHAVGGGVGIQTISLAVKVQDEEENQKRSIYLPCEKTVFYSLL